jgi:hypothetical protein
LIKGADGRTWIEPCSDLILWACMGLQVKVLNEWMYGSYTRQIMNEAWYFKKGVAFTCVGDSFGARLHKYASVIGTGGCSIHPGDATSVVCLMNSSSARKVLESLNPTISFTNGDVERLPLYLTFRAWINMNPELSGILFLTTD